MSLVDRLERVSNGLADRDWLWWPFVAWRPARERRMTALRTFALAAFTVAAALGAVSAYRWATGWPNPLDVLALVGAVAFAIVGALFGGVAWFWNRRARRLAAGAPR